MNNWVKFPTQMMNDLRRDIKPSQAYDIDKCSNNMQIPILPWHSISSHLLGWQELQKFCRLPPTFSPCRSSSGNFNSRVMESFSFWSFLTLSPWYCLVPFGLTHNLTPVSWIACAFSIRGFESQSRNLHYRILSSHPRRGFPSSKLEMIVSASL